MVVIDNIFKRRTGFTLIEVLAAMAVLTVMMMLLMRIFSESSKAMEKGNNLANRDSAARSALEMIQKDLEGMVVDPKCVAYKVANIDEDNYDRIYFITMNGEPEDGRSYQLVKYYVNYYSSPGEKGHRTMRLYRSEIDWTQMMAEKRKVGGEFLDPFGAFEDEWFKYLSDSEWDDVVLAENVVRFDIWVTTATNLNTISGTKDPVFGTGDDWWMSSMGSPPAASPGSFNLRPDDPPAYIDIYLQVASDDAARQAYMMMEQSEQLNNPSLGLMATNLLYKNSNVLMTRAVPIMGCAEARYRTRYEY